MKPLKKRSEPSCSFTLMVSFFPIMSSMITCSGCCDTNSRFSEKRDEISSLPKNPVNKKRSFGKVDTSTEMSRPVCVASTAISLSPDFSVPSQCSLCLCGDSEHVQPQRHRGHRDCTEKNSLS